MPAATAASLLSAPLKTAPARCAAQLPDTTACCVGSDKYKTNAIEKKKRSATRRRPVVALSLMDSRQPVIDADENLLLGRTQAVTSRPRRRSDRCERWRQHSSAHCWSALKTAVWPANVNELFIVECPTTAVAVFEAGSSSTAVDSAREDCFQCFDLDLGEHIFRFAQQRSYCWR